MTIKMDKIIVGIAFTTQLFTAIYCDLELRMVSAKRVRGDVVDSCVWEPSKPLPSGFCAIGQYIDIQANAELRSCNRSIKTIPVARCNNESQLAKPSDAKNVAYKSSVDLLIFTLVCPENYIALSGIATTLANKGNVTSTIKTNYRCVHRTETMTISLQHMLITLAPPSNPEGSTTWSKPVNASEPFYWFHINSNTNNTSLARLKTQQPDNEDIEDDQTTTTPTAMKTSIETTNAPPEKLPTTSTTLAKTTTILQATTTTKLSQENASNIITKIPTAVKTSAEPNTLQTSTTTKSSQQNTNIIVAVIAVVIVTTSLSIVAVIICRKFGVCRFLGKPNKPITHTLSTEPADFVYYNDFTPRPSGGTPIQNMASPEDTPELKINLLYKEASTNKPNNAEHNTGAYAEIVMNPLYDQRK